MGEFRQKRALAAYESWLRIDVINTKADVMRARAVYVCGWAFVLLQIVNFITMTLSYGGLTLDHAIAVAAMVLVLSAVHGMRYTKEFTLIAAFFTILLLGAITASAVQEQTGVNSALLPLLILGPMINGFISGWRMSLVFCLMGCGLLLFLYMVSHGSGSLYALDPVWFEVRNSQRLLQTLYTLLLASGIASIFSYHMFAAFTELEQSAMRAKEAEDSKAAFLTNMSYELRTPLNGMIGMLDLLQDTELNEAQQNCANLAHISGQSLIILIDDILGYSLREAGDVNNVHSEFSLRESIGKIIQVLQPNARAKGIGLHLAFDEALPDAYVGDAGRLRQVMVNLVSNAINFTPAGGVRVSARLLIQQQNEVTFLLRVSDTGVGIAEGDLKTIFESSKIGASAEASVDDGPFNDSCRQDGAGLGLAISKRIVHEMGGKISVESKLNMGSTFSVRLTLPLAVPEQMAALA